ncbi:hypothetical protein KXX34_003069 [Aspergillus fumigatus]|nr:hypothetical protein KXX34_003069 [Aspergillus fumigatus]
MDVNAEDDQSFQQPTTAIARVLCLCLMSFSSPVRDQEWRNRARVGLYIWKTSFDHTRAQIPEEELQRTPLNSGYTGSQATSSDYASSEYLPSLPLDSHPGTGRRLSTQSRPGCSPSDTTPIQIKEHQHESEASARGQRQHHIVPFCTQRCLLGLQRDAPLDVNCLNVALHRQGQNGNWHLVTAGHLVHLLKRQLDEDLDHNCTPFGSCGAYGAPFKITCATYGYTIVGKGMTSRLWKEVSREADIYHVL